MNILRFIGSIAGIIGSLLLAYRVMGILRALALVAETHEININQLFMPNIGQPLFNFRGSPKHVENSQKQILLFLGFALVILSAVLQFFDLLSSTSK